MTVAERSPLAPVEVPPEWTVDDRLAHLELLVGDPSPRVLVDLVEELARDAQRYANARDGHRGRRVSAAETYVDAALAFVQSLPFVRDPSGRDQHQGALWTLAHGGDCEDLAVVLRKLLESGAHPFALASRFEWLERADASQDHVVVQVSIDGGPWEWLEPSVPGARRGVHPFDAVQALGVEVRL